MAKFYGTCERCQKPFEEPEPPSEAELERLRLSLLILEAKAPIMCPGCRKEADSGQIKSDEWWRERAKWTGAT